MSWNWVPIVGTVQIENDSIKMCPTSLPSYPEITNYMPHAFVRSNIPFEQGTVEWQVMLPDPESSCQIAIQTAMQSELYAGLNVMGAPFGFASVSNNSTWEAKGGAGHGTPLKPNCWYDLKLQAHGSNIDLYVNQVKVVSTNASISRGTLSLFLQSKGEVAVRNIRTSDSPSICFVVMQFTPEYNSLYSEVIRPTCEKKGYKVIRADDFYNCGMIIEDVTRSIKESAVIVADVTPDNANVFYELGYAHGIGKDTILLCDRKREKLPFDISGFRTIFYENSIAGKRQIEERLEQHLENLVLPTSTLPLPMPASPALKNKY